MADAKVMDRIRKLLKLAKSDNEHEATLAAERAQALLAEHELELAELELGADEGPAVDPVTCEELFQSGRIPGWKARLGFGIAVACGCQAAHGAGFGMLVYGTDAGIATTKALFGYLVKAIDRLAAEAVRSYRGWNSSRAFGSAYRLGMAQRVVERLKARRSASLVEAAERIGAAPQSVALVRVTQAALVEAKVQAATKGRSWSGPTVSALDALRQGYRDGDGVGLDPQLAAGRSSRKLTS